MPVRGDGPRIGVLGGGQLARMMALAGAPLGMDFVQLAPEPGNAGGLVDTITAGYTDRVALRELAARADVVTYESENIDFEAVEYIASLVTVLPPPRALTRAGDRWAEKDLFSSLDIPTAAYARVESQAQLDEAADRLGLPLVAKTRRLGYDGKGQAVCRTRADVEAAFASLGAVPLLAEQWIPFQRELSIVAVRGRDGELRCYTPVENVHREGILRTTVAPAPDLTPPLRAMAEQYVRRIMDASDYVGVLALELFQYGDALLANEIAPRVHNTGHWTIEGAETSQFENHLRAIAGLPLGSTAVRGCAAMVNLIGTVPPLATLLAVDGARVHVYGKAPRPGRKLGHVTITAPDEQALAPRLAGVRACVEG